MGIMKSFVNLKNSAAVIATRAVIREVHTIARILKTLIFELFLVIRKIIRMSIATHMARQIKAMKPDTSLKRKRLLAGFRNLCHGVLISVLFSAMQWININRPLQFSQSRVIIIANPIINAIEPMRVISKKCFEKTL